MTERIQVGYEQLEKISRQFAEHAEAIANVQSRVRQQADGLAGGGWEGEAAHAFLNEIDGQVIPSLHKLSNALAQGGNTLLQVMKIFFQADDEAKSRFGMEAGGPVDAAGTAPTVRQPIASGGTYTRPKVVQPLPGFFNNRRVPYSISKPSKYWFGELYYVDIGGKKIPVAFVGKPKLTPEGQMHSIEEISKGLAALPPSARALVKRVQIIPFRNPDDSNHLTNQLYDAIKDPGIKEKLKNLLGLEPFETYMTADKEGNIRVYPTTRKMSQDYLDGTLIHETGHTLSRRWFGSDDDNLMWGIWKKAATQDGEAPSDYAMRSAAEDFAETYQLYHQVKGTAAEAETRKRFPARFKIIDMMKPMVR